MESNIKETENTKENMKSCIQNAHYRHQGLLDDIFQ